MTSEVPSFEISKVYVSWLRDQKWQILEREGESVLLAHVFRRTMETATVSVAKIDMMGNCSERIDLPDGDRLYADPRMN